MSKSSKAFGHSKSTKKLPDPKAKKIVSSTTITIETKAKKHSGEVDEVVETKSGKVDTGKGKSGKSNTTDNGKSGKSSSEVVNPKAEKHNSKKSESMLKGKSGKSLNGNSHHNKVKSSEGGGGFRLFHQG